MAAIPDTDLHRIQNDLPATDPGHLDYVTDGMVNDVVVVDRTRVYRFGKHERSGPLMKHEAKVLDLVRARVAVATLQRARIWCATLDLQLALLGHRHDDLRLLVAHVGGAARDLLPTLGTAR